MPQICQQLHFLADITEATASYFGRSHTYGKLLINPKPSEKKNQYIISWKHILRAN